MILGGIREIKQNPREIKYRFNLTRFVLKLIKFNRHFNDVSSIVYEVIRTISSLFIFFFYEKILSAQKHVTSKNQLTKQKQANTKQ